MENRNDLGKEVKKISEMAVGMGEALQHIFKALEEKAPSHVKEKYSKQIEDQKQKLEKVRESIGKINLPNL